MIKFEHEGMNGLEAAIRGMRNPYNSWDKSDSGWIDNGRFIVGANDLELMKKLCKAGTDHRKFMRMITVSADITAPMYWWKEADTYKVGTVRNSCSTMHTVMRKEFEIDDFSTEHLLQQSKVYLGEVVLRLNEVRYLYLNAETAESKKLMWWQVIQLLPSSYNQKATWQANYEVLANIYKSRKNHKLDEWREFCKWIEGVPLSELITGKEKESD